MNGSASNDIQPIPNVINVFTAAEVVVGKMNIKPITTGKNQYTAVIPQVSIIKSNENNSRTMHMDIDNWRERSEFK
ncbi:hypothetical protein ACMAZF_04425 [Psychrobium sp. nBUS_13]|uniref:hypothetical protein n=1 Tax=Psychrobium sp. nBUS_13 TaxID=3395319 RepID=UPI003EC08B95